MARHLDEVEVRAQGLPARPFVDRQDLHVSLGSGATAGGIGVANCRHLAIDALLDLLERDRMGQHISAFRGEKQNAFIGRTFVASTADVTK